MIPHRTYLFQETSVSTNTELKEMLRSGDCPPFPVLRAEKQTGGRGRRGNLFFSPPGGVYFSAAFPLTGEDRNFPFLTLLAGLITARTVESLCGAKTMIKWPNDLYLNGKKLCGILTELISVGERKIAVVGIGINGSTDPSSFPPALRDTATSLAGEGFLAPSPEKLVESIVSALDTQLYENGALTAVKPQYAAEINQRSYLADKSVIVTCGDSVIRGRALFIAPDGSLQVQTAQGVSRVTAGTVEIRC